LRALSRSDVRGEADRSRAILLTLQGWTSLEVAEAFGVTPEAVRHWRGWFSVLSTAVESSSDRAE